MLSPTYFIPEKGPLKTWPLDFLIKAYLQNEIGDINLQNIELEKSIPDNGTGNIETKQFLETIKLLPLGGWIER